MGLYDNYSTGGSCDGFCDCNLSYTPDQVDSSCSLNSIRKTIREIMNAVESELLLGFNVDVEIVTGDGISNIINFSKLSINSMQLTKTTLITPGLAISLCDIAKITVLTSTTQGSTFNINLTNALKNITTTYGGDNTSSGSNFFNNSNVECAQGMQNYINQNLNAVDSISYNGNSVQSQTIQAISDISKSNVLNSSSLNTQSTNALVSSNLETTDIPVINSINFTNNEMSNVETATTTVLSGVTGSVTPVSAPISVTPTNVVTEVQVTPSSNIVTNVESTTKNVVSQVTPELGSVVTDVPAGEKVTGVISNVDAVGNIKPSQVSLPKFTSTGTGTLQVTIGRTTIDGTNPTSDITLNVKVGGQDISFDGNTSKYVLDNDKNLLGGSTNSPNVVEITQSGSPTKDNFVKSISSQNLEVVDKVTPTVSTTNLVNSVTTGEINNIQTPTTKNVVQSLNPVTQSIQNVTSNTKVRPSELFSTTTQNVLNSANINNTFDSFLTNATLSNTNTSVVSNIDTTIQDVTLPVKEEINGRIFTAGDGIMAVNNTNGDLTIYSICDINTVKTV